MKKFFTFSVDGMNGKMGLLFVFFVLLPALVVFAEPLVLEDSQDQYALGKYLQILEDPSGMLTVHDVISPEFSQKFVANDMKVPNFGFTASAYWLRFEVANFSQEKDWLLEVGYPLLDAVDFYFPVAPGFFQNKQAGDRFRFGKRDLKHSSFVFRFPDLLPETRVFYLRVQTIDGTVLPLTVWSKDAFFKHDHEQQYVWGIYYGVMLVMVIYNLFLCVGIRHISYLFYVFYILTFSIFQMTLNGLAYEYLWPDFPQWNTHSWSFLMAVASCWAILFAQSFLQTARYAPFLHKVFYGLLALLVGSLVIGFLPYDFMINQLRVILILPIAFIFIVAGALCWKRGYQPARYYLLAWIFLILGAITIALKGFGILPSMFLTEYGLQIGSALEVVLLSLALADRLNLLEQEKLEAQTKISEQEKEYRELVENLNVGVLRTDDSPRGNILKANSATLKIFGYEPSDIKNIHSATLYQHQPDEHQVRKTLEAEGELKSQEVLAKRKDGRSIWISVNAIPHRDAQGHIQWVDSIIEDITQRKEAEEKIQRLSNTFEKFVPQQFLNRIASEGIDHIELGKAQTESLSVLFADIHAFTNLSETISPQETLDFLNTYLAEMNQPIQNCYGFIDKFIGDGIMALFDRPTHSTDSFRSSIAMAQAIQAFNQERAKENRPPISIGIAIHSGNAIIGTVGTKDRMDSTVLGDTVNLAARMERLTNYYNAQIIISSDTHETIQDGSLLCRELDFIAVKGKKIPKRIFEVFNGDEARILEKKQHILVPYTEGLKHYRTRHWQEAIGLFEECLSIYPEDVVSQMYIGRCRQFQQTPPDASWKGETRMH